MRAAVKELRKVDHDYVKVVLYAYPSLEEIGDAVAVSAETKALLSYRDPRSAEDVAADIWKEISAKRALRELCALVDSLLSELSEEELFLLEYKYFRRKEVLRGEFAGFSLAYTERHYFRKQNRLLKKAADYFQKNGWSRERFLEETNGLFTRVMNALGRGRECSVHGQRKRGFFHSP